MPDRRPLIRHLASSIDGRCIAAAEFERHVQIWDAFDKQRTSWFETTLDFGGDRLAISRDSKYCAVGAYHRDGIALYDTSSGTEAWRRSDLKKVQRVGFSLDDRWVLCGFESGDFELLSRDSGASPPGIADVTWVWESPHDQVRILGERNGGFRCVGLDGGDQGNIRGRSSDVLCHAFAPGVFCHSYAGAGVNCYDLDQRALAWRHSPEPGEHVIKLAFLECRDIFAAVVWPYQRGGPKQLIQLAADTGAMVGAVGIGEEIEVEFCQNGATLITSSGAIYDVASLTQSHRLDFFDAEYTQSSGLRT